MRPITGQERDTFEMIRTLEGGGPPEAVGEQRLAIISVEFDGEATAAIAMIERQPGNTVMTYPLAILLTETMFNRVTPPTPPITDN